MSKDPLAADISAAAAALGLGKPDETPLPVKGGLLHRMYRIGCGGKEYAVKCLNAEIMKREDALNNMIFSEKAAGILADDVPAVCALEIGGRQVHCIDGRWYMVFPWHEGESVYPPEITKEHCRTIGRLLGKIHHVKLQPEKNQEAARFDQEITLADLEKDREKEWARQLMAKWAFVKEIEANAQNAAAMLKGEEVISHRDLDPKNVLWHKGKAYLIDWEAAGPVNPWQELADTLLYWTVDDKGNAVEGLFRAFTEGYNEMVDLSGMPAETAFNASFLGLMEWLWYNVRRASDPDAKYTEEKRRGEQQVLLTLKEIEVRKDLAGRCIGWLKG